MSVTQHRLGKAGHSCPPEVLDKRRLLGQAVAEQYSQNLAAHFLISAALNETHLLGDERDLLACELLSDADSLLSDSLEVAVSWDDQGTDSKALGTLYVAAHV